MYFFHLTDSEISALRSHSRNKGREHCGRNVRVIWSVSVGCERLLMTKHNRKATSLLVSGNGPDVWNPPYGGGTDPPCFHSYSKIKDKDATHGAAAVYNTTPALRRLLDKHGLESRRTVNQQFYKHLTFFCECKQ